MPVIWIVFLVRLDTQTPPPSPQPTLTGVDLMLSQRLRGGMFPRGYALWFGAGFLCREMAETWRYEMLQSHIFHVNCRCLINVGPILIRWPTLHLKSVPHTIPFHKVYSTWQVTLFVPERGQHLGNAVRGSLSRCDILFANYLQHSKNNP